MHWENKNNIWLGTLGAFLGSCIGGLSILLLGQLGIFSSIAGVILAVCTLFGFRKLGGKPAAGGLVICFIFMLIMPYLADRISWSLAIMKAFETDFWTAFTYTHSFIADYNAYVTDLAFLYAFTALGCLGILYKPRRARQSSED